MTKYKEVLWEGEPEENPFKVGDRVRAYNPLTRYDCFEIDEVIDAYVYTGSDRRPYHFRQCRKLEEMEPREWTLTGGLHRSWEGPIIGALETVKVREVLEDDK